MPNLSITFKQLLKTKIHNHSISVETARKEAVNYKQQFDRPIPLKILNDRLASFIHAYTLYSAVRPFGISAILACCDPITGPEMYMIEPSGSSYVSKLILLDYFHCYSRQ